MRKMIQQFLQKTEEVKNTIKSVDLEKVSETLTKSEETQQVLVSQRTIQTPTIKKTPGVA